MTTAIDQDLKLEFKPDARLLSTARLFAAAAARYFGCDEDVVQDVKIAVSEACTNAVKAQNSADVSDPVRVVVRQDDERVHFEVVDSGAGFDPSTRTKPDTMAESGIGLHIIESLFPDCEVKVGGQGGTVVHFSVHPL